MKKLKHWIAALMFVTVAGGATFTVATPQPAAAACSETLLTFPAWYRGLLTGDCDIKSPKQAGGLPTFIWTIVLNVIETMMQLVGFISLGFIIAGGFKYMTSAGSSSGMASAKTTILNAMIGLGISIFSVAIVNVIAGAIK